MLNRVFCANLVILCLSIAGFAQTVEGVITGRVEDTSGARIPGVAVTLSSRALQGDKSVVSDENGGYRFPGLPPGTYSVKYELAGFSTLIREGILVEVSRTVTLVVQLQVATVAETVTVAVRAEALVFSCAVTVTVPLFEPDAGLTVSHV